MAMEPKKYFGRIARYGNVYPGIGSETDIGEGDACGDPVGNFIVQPEGYSIMVELLMKYAGGKLILTLEGGCDVKILSKCIETLLTSKQVIGSPYSLIPKTNTLEIIKKVRK